MRYAVVIIHIILSLVAGIMLEVAFGIIVPNNTLAAMLLGTGGIVCLVAAIFLAYRQESEVRKQSESQGRQIMIYQFAIMTMLRRLERPQPTRPKGTALGPRPIPLDTNTRPKENTNKDGV